MRSLEGITGAPVGEIPVSALVGCVDVSRSQVRPVMHELVSKRTVCGDAAIPLRAAVLRARGVFFYADLNLPTRKRQPVVGIASEMEERTVAVEPFDRRSWSCFSIELIPNDLLCFILSWTRFEGTADASTGECQQDKKPHAGMTAQMDRKFQWRN